jgi:UDPglucose 6-dehydrogenase
MTKVGIVGYGHVGKSLNTIFKDTIIYDKFMKMQDKNEINNCDIVFVSVSTPSLPNGSCDLSNVNDVMNWLDVPLICIKSTVPPGTTDSFCDTGKVVTMSPEFYGETPWQKSADEWPYLIVGGESKATQQILDLYRSYLGPGKSYWATTAKNAELVKYMGNAWLAMQVTFAYQFSDISKTLGADYNTVRELWALDPRVSRWHTLIIGDRGYGGDCLPKDLSAIIAISEEKGCDASFLNSIRNFNDIGEGTNT